jgi:hypothetical protein
MRIDPVQVLATIKQADPAFARRASVPSKSAEESPNHDIGKAATAATPAPKQISVLMDSDSNLIYQFIDARTGEVVLQVPPQQVLQVMRSIADLLRESEQRLKITI